MDEKDSTGISKEKTVCFFGIYDPEFIRNAVLIGGLKKNGHKVIECAVDPGLGSFQKFATLYKKGKQLHREYDIDYVFVAFPGNTVVWLARLIFGKKIIFDAFLSQYDANVGDRKIYGRWHPLAFRDWFYDWYACMMAWRVLLPERVHIDYFVRTFHLPRDKFIRVFTGANDVLFHPRPDAKKPSDFTVHFHGSFIPLQGVDHIIDAARILKDESIHFQIVGSGGSLYNAIQQKVSDQGLENVHLLGRKPLEEIPQYIAQAHVCLGVFGDSDKTQRVISNKIYECVAMGASVITARTPATEELFTDREHVLFAEAANGADLAEKIRELKNDVDLRERIAQGAREIFEEKLTPRKIAGDLLGFLGK